MTATEAHHRLRFIRIKTIDDKKYYVKGSTAIVCNKPILAFYTFIEDNGICRAYLTDTKLIGKMVKYINGIVHYTITSIDNLEKATVERKGTYYKVSLDRLEFIPSRITVTEKSGFKFYKGKRESVFVESTMSGMKQSKGGHSVPCMKTIKRTIVKRNKDDKNDPAYAFLAAAIEHFHGSTSTQAKKLIYEQHSMLTKKPSKDLIMGVMLSLYLQLYPYGKEEAIKLFHDSI